MTGSNLLMPRQASDKIGISYPALKHLFLAGRIRSVKTPGGHHRYPWKHSRNSCPPTPPANSLSNPATQPLPSSKPPKS